ncbi:hypothetical protein D9756_010872 [Leucocoprinus leucothites]|uniref:Uncharacterized protein n=1 Tax=Leucocoprinus leucothites TaxID=201217 RepID=A0A8H5CPT1_9AGAR|nr:hypothetical protein D9756_010872 [Leucoagaricus leucothites]
MDRKQMAMLRFYLRMSKELPFTLNISFDPPPRSDVTRLLDRIRNVLVNESGGTKIRYPEMEDVAEAAWIYSFYDLDFRHVHRLKIVDSRVRDGFPRHIILSWSQITTLTLKSVTITLSSLLLTQCPNLVTFHSFTPTAEPTFLPQINCGPVVLQHLCHLTWSYEPCRSYEAVFPSMRLPALQTLTWCRHQPRPAVGPGEYRALKFSMESLPASLRTLEISTGGYWGDFLLSSLFTSVSGARHLRFHVLISEALALLSSNPSPSEQVGLLPFLEKLVVLSPQRISIGGSEWWEDSVVHLLEEDIMIRRIALVPGATTRYKEDLRSTFFPLGRWTPMMYDVFQQLQLGKYPFYVWVDLQMTSPLTPVDTLRTSLIERPSMEGGNDGNSEWDFGIRSTGVGI